MKIVTRYVCEICRTEYDTEVEAELCEAQKYEPLFAPGDIVTIEGSCYGWFDGDSSWISNFSEIQTIGGARGEGVRRYLECPNGNGNCFGSCCNYLFYFVVTAVVPDPRELHRPLYHVYSKALKNGKKGWTCKTHHMPKLVPNPPTAIVEESRSLIGQTYTWLL